MRIVRYVEENQSRYGVIDGETLFSLPDGLSGDLTLGGPVGPSNEASLLAPCDPRIIVCAGRNYSGQLAEKGISAPSHPSFFLKAVNAVTGPGRDIRYPKGLNRLEYEGELAVVIGRTSHAVAMEDVPAHVLGYTCANDVTADDWRADGQWVRAKSTDTFCPLGPWIETDVTDPDDLGLLTKVNGQTVQDSRTSDMIFDVATLVAYITRWVTLGPGDIVLTGSPANVGALHAGDIVEVEIEGVGRLSNRVR